MKSKIALRIKEDDLYDEAGDGDDPITKAKRDAISFLLGDGDGITEEELPAPQTDADLDNLIAALKRDRESMPEYSMFGDPNWQETDAQIRICEWAKGG